MNTTAPPYRLRKCLPKELGSFVAPYPVCDTSCDLRSRCWRQRANVGKQAPKVYSRPAYTQVTVATDFTVEYYDNYKVWALNLAY